MIDQNVKNMSGPVSETRTTRTTGFSTSSDSTNPTNPLDVASVAMKVGDVIFKIGSFIGSVFKGKTQHVDWTSANNISLQYGQEIETSVRKQFGNANADKISIQFRQNMIAFMSAIDRWGEGYPQNKAAIINALKVFNPALPQQGSIAYTYWGWNMWALINSDANNPDAYAVIANYDMGKTLYKAIFDVTGQTVSTLSPTGQVTPGTTPSTASLFSGNNVLILAAVGIGAFIFFRRN